MKCISCNHEHEDNFCPICGEKNGVKRITLVSIAEDVMSSITSMDKGFLYNLKTLCLKPQKIAEDYINGKRKGILNPISYLIFSITIYLIVITVFKTPIEPSEVKNAPTNEIGRPIFEAGKFLRSGIKYFWIIAIFPLGLSLKIAFRKKNYFEYVAISSFVIGHATLVGVISFLIFKKPLILDPIVYLVIFWIIYKVFENKNAKFKSILKSTLAMILFVLQLFLTAMIIALIIGVTNL